MKYSIFFLLISLGASSLFFCGCNGQATNNQKNQIVQKYDSNKIVGGGCDGCEIMYVGIPVNIKPVDTSSGWFDKGQKLLVEGTVYQIDGKTPAPGVIIYYYHTDNNGYYSDRPDLDPKAKRHGHIRGWVRTDEKGKYSIYTNKPAPYPNRGIPAHIHLSVKEPEIRNEYYIDELIFDDDKLLTDEKRKGLDNRGGSGIVKIKDSGGFLVAEHNIILGLNIPNYPGK